MIIRRTCLSAPCRDPRRRSGRERRHGTHVIGANPTFRMASSSTKIRRRRHHRRVQPIAHRSIVHGPCGRVTGSSSVSNSVLFNRPSAKDPWCATTVVDGCDIPAWLLCPSTTRINQQSDLAQILRVTVTPPGVLRGRGPHQYRPGQGYKALPTSFDPAKGFDTTAPRRPLSQL